MKSTLAFYIGISLFTCGLLSGCGQPGPLYMPKLPAKPAASAPNGAAAPEFTPAPVPAPPAMPELKQ
ncbi:LPS translocon maturation chaperone LptM [Janthinobacterium sp.]|uniref:LPS translocon maturation chaperone LptM n=1 Tax=Janthinobacterium sp. TaxID=1871054 RepID=UPI00293D5086|nr:lipoprotein [Janthinobacterium sp.]